MSAFAGGEHISFEFPTAELAQRFFGAEVRDGELRHRVVDVHEDYAGARKAAPVYGGREVRS
jgi:hypothetical protein